MSAASLPLIFNDTQSRMHIPVVFSGPTNIVEATTLALSGIQTEHWIGTS